MTDRSRSGSIVIAGGSGFLGLSLAAHLAASGRSSILLSRTPPKPSGPWRHLHWDARTLGDWCRELDGAIGLVNLTGRTVDCIKTPDHQDEILRSRLEATRSARHGRSKRRFPAAGVGADEHGTHLRRPATGHVHRGFTIWLRSRAVLSVERGKTSSERACCPRSVRSSCEPAS